MDGKGKVFVVGLDNSINAMFLNRGYSILRSNDMIDQADIVCFIGGFDIDPEIYGQVKNAKANVSISHSDDKRDINAWNRTRPEQLRVGICRGGQFIHVMNGGKLFQHVSGHASKHIVHDTIWKKERRVSSSHHQMMIPNDTSEVFAYAEGIGDKFTGEYGDMQKPKFEPEILWYERTNSLCVQSHPEWDRNGELGEQDYFFNILEMVR